MKNLKPKRRNTATFIEDCSNAPNWENITLGEFTFTRMVDHVPVHCNIHHTDFTQSGVMLLRGSFGCPECQSELQALNKGRPPKNYNPNNPKTNVSTRTVSFKLTNAWKAHIN